VAYVRQLYTQHARLAFTPRRVVAEADASVIEFELLLSDDRLIGTDVIEWSDGRIAALRAYLYPAKS
jgi:ketosteroid isomerase-like protein